MENQHISGFGEAACHKGMSIVRRIYSTSIKEEGCDEKGIVDSSSACFIVAGFASAVAAADVKMVLATGGTAGTYYPFGGAMAKIWNSKIPGMNVTAQATGASVENVRLVNRGEAELAIVQSDTIDFAFNAKEAFKEKLTKMAVLAVLYPEVIQVVVRGDSKIDSFDDLKGMKVGVGAPGSGTEANFRQLSDGYGLKKEDVKAQYLSFSESAEQFKDKHIDAFIVTAGIPNAAIMDIGSQHSIRIINIADDKAALIVKKYPFLSPFTIPANTYKNQTSAGEDHGRERGPHRRHGREGRRGLQYRQDPVREPDRTGRQPMPRARS